MVFIGEFIILSTLLLIIILWKEKKTENFLSIRMANEMKGVAILIIFLVHAFPEATVVAKYGGYGVGVFLFLSGYGLYQSNQLEAGKSKSFMQKRIMRLFPPLLIFLLIFTLFWMISPSVSSLVLGGHPAPDILSFIYANFAFSPLWFVPFILFWYLSYFFLLKSNVSKKIKIAVLFFLGIVIIFARPFEVDPAWQTILSWFVYPLCFPAGVFISYYREKTISYLSKPLFNSPVIKISSCLLIFLITFSIWDYSQSLSQKSIHYPVTSILFIVGFLLFFYFFMSKLRSCFLNLLGKVSYEFYLFHSLLIAIFIDTGQNYFFNNYLFSFFFTLAFAIGLSRIVKKIITSLLQKSDLPSVSS